MTVTDIPLLIVSLPAGAVMGMIFGISFFCGCDKCLGVSVLIGAIGLFTLKASQLLLI